MNMRPVFDRAEAIPLQIPEESISQTGIVIDLLYFKGVVLHHAWCQQCLRQQSDPSDLEAARQWGEDHYQQHLAARQGNQG